MKKVIETRIQKRFADIDIFRHVNNISQMAYLDLGKTDYYRRVLGFDVQELGERRPTLVIVATRSDFLGQVRYEDETVVRTWVERVGTKSITLRQQIVRIGGGGGVAAKAAAPAAETVCIGSRQVAETICTESETTVACFDPATQRAVELPAAWRITIGE
jgi:YbgC/YbaW family acyl-CoA thioester hydrolase